MPFDRFGHPFFYASKTGGWFYQLSDNPKNDSGADWADGSSFSNGIITMNPKGSTSHGIGKNLDGFNGSIGGCNMDFAKTAERGYAYKQDDARDLEIKAILKIAGTGSNGFSISVCTGRHTGSQCCQGFAYMITVEVADNPSKFNFRKEMWHVSYHTSPVGEFTHPKCNFRIRDYSKYVGIGFCRYNDPNSITDTVVLEIWFNPDPDANKTDWTMLKRFKDKNGVGWGNDGGKCNGAKDQAGVWSNVNNRFKTNASGGTVKIKELTLREIDPSNDFDTDPNPPPNDPVTRFIHYFGVGQIVISALAISNISWIFSEELVETLTDPDPDEKFGDGGYRSWGNAEMVDEIGDWCDVSRVGGDMSQGIYADGLKVKSYWSNSDNNCVAPGAHETDLGSSNLIKTHGGNVLENATLYLIFWGDYWNNLSNPITKTMVETEIRDKMLGTDVQYFSKLNQYGGVQAPTWGGSVLNTLTPLDMTLGSAGRLTGETEIRRCIVDTFNSGLLSIPAANNDNVYAVMLPPGKLYHAGGHHEMFRPSLIPPPVTQPPTQPPPTPPPSGGGTTKVIGNFTLLRDINITRTSACAGSSGGGGSGGSSRFYIVPADNDKELADVSKWDYRTRIGAKIKKSGSAMNGKILKQLDVPLKKIGSPAATPTITAVIWNANGQPIYTSPTAIDPTTLTTSFVTKQFDFSANTHIFVVGDMVGIRYYADSSTSDVNYVVGGYESVTTAGNTVMFQTESGIMEEKPSRDFAADMWD